MPTALPPQPNIDWLRKTAKQRLDQMRAADPTARLADAQHELARDYGFASWRALKSHVDTVSIDGRLVAAAVAGDARQLAELLAQHPAKLTVAGGRWKTPLLHLAAEHG